MADPLVLTLALDEAAQARFDRERAQHFPPGRNHLAAHVTLFHALPGDEAVAVRAAVGAAADRGPFAVQVTGVRSLGRGAAYVLDAPEAGAVHRALTAALAPWLTPQDRQPLRPHVTVANKLAPQRARALVEELGAAFAPWTATATGLALWHYRGGPWEPAGRWPFGTPGRLSAGRSGAGRAAPG